MSDPSKAEQDATSVTTKSQREKDEKEARRNRIRKENKIFAEIDKQIGNRPSTFQEGDENKFWQDWSISQNQIHPKDAIKKTKK